jgi:hypothetical protein
LEDRCVTNPNQDQTPVSPSLGRVSMMRRMFWENVVREILTGLSMVRDRQPELFDGRMAVLTHGGERIPIAEVTPMFACGIPGTPAEKAASIAVECTVFRIRTPSGEVFTFPLSEIRGLHALSSDLVRELEREAREQLGDTEENPKPFGLAAFRSVAESSEEAKPAEPETE